MDENTCEIFRFLIENGGNVNAYGNYCNWTPLMEASMSGLENVVTFLVKHGANMDLQDENGDTALHHAVGYESTDVVHKLLTLGAAQLYNNDRLTPLLLASTMWRISMVEELINRPECTKEQRINALELLGASATLWDDHERAYQYMKRGMEERFQDPLNPLLKQPMEPIEAYQYRKESQTLEELAGIESDNDAIAMECLVIRERILGQDNLELLDAIHDRAEKLQYRNSKINYDISIGLRRHAVKVAQHCNKVIGVQLEFLTSALCDMAKDHFAPSQKVILEVLEQAILEWKKEEEQQMLNRLLDSIFYLLQFLAKDLLCGELCDGDKNLCTSVLLQKLCSLNPRDNDGNTLLHLAAAGRFPVKGYVDDLFGFPCVKTVKLLLNAGINVDAINNKGDTALHRAATLNPGHWEKYHLITDMLQVLLDGGAHHDFVNNDGKTAMDMATNVQANNFLSDKKGLELKCISAKAVKKFGLPYLGVVPKTLEKYVNMH